MRPAMVRKACQPGLSLAPAIFGRTMSATLAETLMVFLATNLRYRNLRSRIQSELQQIQQERQFLRGIPGQIVILRIADGQLGVLIPQIRGVDRVDRGQYRRLSGLVVDISRDHLV